MGDRLGTPWLPVKNASADAVPPGGLVVPTGAVDPDTGDLVVDKAAADDAAGFLVNGEFTIPAGGSGNAADQNNAVVAYDAADGTPAPGQAWGVKAGTFLARKGRSGFVVVATGMAGTFVGMRYVSPPSAATAAARLIASTGWQGRSWTVGVGWADNTASGTNFETVEIDGVPFLQKPTATAVYWPSRAPGYYEGVPIQYANKVGGTYYPGFVSTGAIGTQVFGGDKTFDGAVQVHDSLTVNYAHTGANLVVSNNTSGTTFGVFPGSASGADVIACGPFYQSLGQFAPTVGDGTQFVAAAVNTMGLALWANSGAGPHGEATQSGSVYFSYTGGLGSVNLFAGAGAVPSASVDHLPSNGNSLAVAATAYPGGFRVNDGSGTQNGLWGTNAVGDTFKGGMLTGFGAGGSVTSVQVSGGTTGLTTSGGPITGAGTITLGGTLGVANGGTGQTTIPPGQVVTGNGTAGVTTLGNTRTSGGSLELKLGTNRWVAFGLGSY